MVVRINSSAYISICFHQIGLHSKWKNPRARWQWPTDGILIILFNNFQSGPLFFVEAALSIVLMACTMRPRLPIIFPISSLATFSSITMVCCPSISVIKTSSGLSTSAFAMYAIRSLISIHLHFSFHHNIILIFHCLWIYTVLLKVVFL